MPFNRNSVTLRKKKLAGGRVSLYLDIYTQGKRTYEMLGLYLNPGDKQQNGVMTTAANIIRAQREKEIMETARRISLGIEHKYTSFQDFIQKKHPPKTKHTAVVYKNWVKINGETTEFTRLLDGVEKFMKWLGTKSIATQQNYAIFLKVWIKQACKERAIIAEERDNILQFIKDNTPSKQKRHFPKFLTSDELDKLCRTTPLPCDAAVARAFMFACMTGLRVSDVANLHPKQIDAATRTLHFRQKKTNEDVAMPLSDAAMLLCSTPDTAERVFSLALRKDGTTPLSHVINNALNRWASLAGVTKYITFHISRHTFATNLINSEVSIYTVKELLGHSSLASTEIYTHLNTSQKREAINRLPSLGLNKNARNDELRAIEELKEKMHSVMSELERLENSRKQSL